MKIAAFVSCISIAFALPTSNTAENASSTPPSTATAQTIDTASANASSNAAVPPAANIEDAAKEAAAAASCPIGSSRTPPTDLKIDPGLPDEKKVTLAKRGWYHHDSYGYNWYDDGCYPQG